MRHVTRGLLRVAAAERWSVFVIGEGRARLRTVEVGHRGDAEAEVTRGLREGEQVILYPSDQVADGVHVEPRGLRNNRE